MQEMEMTLTFGDPLAVSSEAQSSNELTKDRLKVSFTKTNLFIDPVFEKPADADILIG